MPIIPYVEESQKLVASNPVPIAGTGDARMEGDAMARTGAALFNLGDALDKIGKRQKSEEDKLRVEIAMNELRKRTVAKQAAAASAAPIEGDNTGIKQVEAFQSAIQEDIDDISSQFEDPKQATMFQARSGDLVVDSSIQTLGIEVKKRAEYTKELKSQVMGEYVGSVRVNPSNLSMVMPLAELTIRDDENTTPAQKELDLLNIKKELVSNAIEGHKANGDYAEAQLVLKREGKIFDAADYQKISTQIDESDWKSAGRSLQQANLQEKLADKSTKAREKNLTQQYYVQLQQAGNSTIKREVISNDMQKKVAAGMMDPKLMDSLLGNKIFSKQADEIWESNVISEAWGKSNYNDLQKRMYADLRSGERVSPEKYNEVMGTLRNLKERGSDPKFKKLSMDGENLIKSIASDTILDSLAPLDKRGMLAKMNSVMAQYHRAVARSPEADPFEIARNLYETSFGAVVPVARGTSFMNMNDPKKIDDAINKRHEEEEQRKQNGTSTPDTRLDSLKTIDGLMKQKQRVIKVNPTKDSPAQKAPTTSGARGR